MNMLQDILNQDLDPTETQEGIDALNAVHQLQGSGQTTTVDRVRIEDEELH